MPFLVDNIELDETNEEFYNASRFVNETNKPLYLTGKAGTGKTTFLKYIRQTTDKNIVVVAPTGVAAINAGGRTIHSFFHIKPGSFYLPNDSRLRTKAPKEDKDRSTIYDHFRFYEDDINVIRNMDVLIIDEISMVRCDMLDVIDTLLRIFRRKKFEPFGGVQLVLIGDTFQLPPIAQFEEWEILQKFYKSPYFFHSKAIKNNPLTYIELKKIYRQNEKDFINLLNKVRINKLLETDLKLLNSKHNPSFIPVENSNFIMLATHNRIVDETNLIKLAELKTELKSFDAQITGTFPENMFPTDKVLQLKEGAQIMFIRNDKLLRRYFNGKIAKIKSINDNKIIVQFSKDDEITIEKDIWRHIHYNWNEKQGKVEEEIIGTFQQFPIKLAWAITVHKSQGLTFENVYADLGAAFAPGQVYVALSRCTSFGGLILKSRIEGRAIKTDMEVLNFAQSETPNTLIIQEINAGIADSFYKKSREAVKLLRLTKAFNYFIEAIKYRNDINTEIFNRYLIIIKSKLNISSSLFSEFITVLEFLKNENYKISMEKEEFVITSEQFKDGNKKKNEIQLLFHRIKEFEKNNLQYNERTTETPKDISKSNKEIILPAQSIPLQKDKIIKPIKLKWYKKLFKIK